MLDRFATNSAYLALLLMGLCAFALLAHGIELRISRFVTRRWGWRAVLVTGWLGVPLHELSHLLTAKLFGHRIISWTLFEPDPVTGTLGHVRHAYREDTLYQHIGYAFVGFAPLLFGLLALCGLITWMLPWDQASGLIVKAPFPIANPGAWSQWAALGKHQLHLMEALAVASWSARTAFFPLQLYLGTCVSAHMAPSRSDFVGSRKGLAAMVFVLMIASATGALVNVELSTALLALTPLPPLLVLSTSLLGAYGALVAFMSRTSGVRFPRTGH